MNTSGFAGHIGITQMIALEAQYYDSTPEVAAKAWDRLFDLEDVPDCNLNHMVPLLVHQASDILAMERRA